MKSSMKKSVVALSVLIGMPLLGCATQPQQNPNRQVSSDGREYKEGKPQPACAEHEVRSEVDGSCERVQKVDRPFRRGGK